MSTPPLHLVVFDVDGTLVDSLDAIARAMTRAFEATGEAAPARAQVARIIGLSLDEAVARLAPRAGPASRAAIVAAYRDSFVAMRSAGAGEGASPLYEGARAALDRLSARESVLLGVATGKARRGLDHMIAAHGLAGRFVTAQTADLHPSKPHPGMLHAALAETGVAARHAAMVGDTVYDMKMACAAGIAPLGVAWGYHEARELRAAGAAHVIGHFDEIDAALAEMLEGFA